MQNDAPTINPEQTDPKVEKPAAEPTPSTISADPTPVTSQPAPPNFADDQHARAITDEHETEDDGDGFPDEDIVPIEGSGASLSTPTVQTVAFTLPVDHRGTLVYVKGWINPSSTAPALVVHHDVSENLSVYRVFAKRLAARGISVYCFDARGHGRSGGRLGHAQHFQDFVNDTLQVMAWVKHRSQGLSPFLVGHGFGALVALYFQLKYPKMASGYVLSSPLIALKYQPQRWRRVVIRGLSDVIPTLKLPFTLSPHLNVDLRFGENTTVFKVQPFQQQHLSARFANETLDAIDHASARLLRFRAPTLVLLPETDDIADHQLFKDVLYRHKRRGLFQVEQLPNCGHHIFTEHRQALNRAIAHVQTWLNHRLTKQKEVQPNVAPTV